MILRIIGDAWRFHNISKNIYERDWAHERCPFFTAAMIQFPRRSYPNGVSGIAVAELQPWADIFFCLTAVFLCLIFYASWRRLCGRNRYHAPVSLKLETQYFQPSGFFFDPQRFLQPRIIDRQPDTSIFRLGLKVCWKRLPHTGAIFFVIPFLWNVSNPAPHTWHYWAYTSIHFCSILTVYLWNSPAPWTGLRVTVCGLAFCFRLLSAPFAYYWCSFLSQAGAGCRWPMGVAVICKNLSAQPEW